MPREPQIPEPARSKPVALRNGAHFAQIKALFASNGHRRTAFRPATAVIGVSEAWCVPCRYLVMGQRQRERAYLIWAPALEYPCLGNPDHGDGGQPPHPGGPPEAVPSGGGPGGLGLDVRGGRPC